MINKDGLEKIFEEFDLPQDIRKSITKNSEIGEYSVTIHRTGELEGLPDESFGYRNNKFSIDIRKLISGKYYTFNLDLGVLAGEYAVERIGNDGIRLYEVISKEDKKLLLGLLLEGLPSES